MPLALSVLLWAARANALGPGPPAAPNDDCANATTISTVAHTENVLTSAATTEPSDPTPMCGNGSRGKSVWYVFTAPSHGTVTADTFATDTLDTDYDTILSVYTGSCGGLQPVSDGCSDDDPFDGAQSKVSLPIPAGTTYYFMVSAFEDDGGSLVFRLRFFPSNPPLFGDANCDGRRTAADLPAVIMLITASRRAPCGLDDANHDGVLNTDDITGVIAGIFAP